MPISILAHSQSGPILVVHSCLKGVANSLLFAHQIRWCASHATITDSPLALYALYHYEFTFRDRIVKMLISMEIRNDTGKIVYKLRHPSRALNWTQFHARFANEEYEYFMTRPLEESACDGKLLVATVAVRSNSSDVREAIRNTWATYVVSVSYMRPAVDKGPSKAALPKHRADLGTGFFCTRGLSFPSSSTGRMLPF